MLRKTLTSLLARFGASSQSAPTGTAEGDGGQLRHHATPVYPPIDHGIPRVSVDHLIESQGDLLHRLRLAAGTSDERFEHLYLVPVRNLARTVGLIPATESETHKGAGGLFRLALELSFYALQSSESRIFAARAGVERRRLLEPRWQYATWLAGLTCELYRPVTTMVVTTSDGDQWPAYQEDLDLWLERAGAQRVFVRWVEQRPGKPRPGRGAAAAIAQRIIPRDALEFLREESTEIVPTMLDVITGAGAVHDKHPMAQIIDSVRERVMERDKAVSPSRYGQLTVGQHAEPHLLDAMRRLYKNGTWKTNFKKARLWLGDEGLFLVWPTAAKEILSVLQEDGVVGIPRDPQTLVDILIEAEVFEEHHEGGPYWTIMPPLASNELAAVKFANPDALFGDGFDVPESAGLITKRRASDRAVEKAKAEKGAPEGPESEAPSVKVAPPEAAVVETDAHPTHDQAKPSESPGQARPRKRDSDSAGAGGKEKDVGSNITERLGKGLDPLTRDVFGALLEDLRSGAIVNEAGRVREGFAIGLEQLAGYGVDVTTFASAVQSAGWLYTNDQKPNKKIHEVQINGKLQRAVIIRAAVATDLGLIL